MMILIPFKPAILVLGLLTGLIFVGFVGSSLLEGKEPFVLAELSGIEDALLPFRWYNQSIIAPGVETSYTSFGWLGFIFYSLAFFAIAWNLCLFLICHPLSPPLKLCGFVLIGCGIFFVRGTLSGWIGYSIAYTVTILGSAPLWAFVGSAETGFRGCRRDGSGAGFPECIN